MRNFSPDVTSGSTCQRPQVPGLITAGFSVRRRVSAFLVVSGILLMCLWIASQGIVNMAAIPPALLRLMPQELVAPEKDYNSIDNETYNATMHLPGVIFYNRIRKTGSETTSHLFNSMSRSRNFTVFWDWKKQPPQRYRYIDDTQYKQFTSGILKRKRPLLFIKHMYFIDFNRFHVDSQPQYINIVRDPVKRKVSEYNYMRFRKDRYHKLSKKDRFMSMDKCIFNRHTECYSTVETAVLTSFFCGYDAICGSNTSTALQLAKRNIKRHFVVVGQLERMRETMAALECTIPSYFTGLLKQYDRLVNQSKSISNRTPYRTVPSPKAEKLLRYWLKQEFELVAWIAQHFDKQLRTLRQQCPHLLWDR